MKKAWYIIGGLGLALGGYFVYDLTRVKKQQEKTDKGTSNETTVDIVDGTGQGAYDAQKGNDAFPLEIGDYGGNVHTLQLALNHLGANLVVDGKYGANTYDAVRTKSSGFGFLNFACSIGRKCGLNYDEFLAILNQAEDRGFKTAKAWEEAGQNWVINS